MVDSGLSRGAANDPLRTFLVDGNIHSAQCDGPCQESAAELNGWIMINDYGQRSDQARQDSEALATSGD